jgi:hypothetical protein
LIKLQLIQVDLPLRTLATSRIRNPERCFSLFDSGQNPCCSVGNSAHEALANAAHKTGRAKTDFELRKISKEEYDQLKSLLQL